MRVSGAWQYGCTVFRQVVSYADLQCALQEGGEL